MIDTFTNSIDQLVEKLQSWLDQMVLMLPNFVLSILVIIGFVLLAKLSRRLFNKTIRSFSDNVAVNKLLSTVIYLGIITIGIFVALGVLQLSKTVTSLLAGVGVVGLALGFAFQNTAANFISGIFMATRHPINVGDIVEANGFFGTVTMIDMRFTKILSPQGQEVIIPNRTILENPLINYTTTGERRVDLSCGVSYGENLEKVKQVAISAIENHLEHNKDKPVDLIFTEFGDSSINFTIRFWIGEGCHNDYLQAMSLAIIHLKQAFDQNDISIPFPIRTLDFGIKGGVSLDQQLPLDSLLEKQYSNA